MRSGCSGPSGRPDIALEPTARALAIIMLGWLFKQFKPSGSGGAFLSKGCWEVLAPSNHERIAAALEALLPAASVLVLEGTSIDPEVESRLSQHFVAPALDIRSGTIWPRPKLLHIAVSPEALRILQELLAIQAEPEICDHLYAYANGVLLLQWHDAFDDPIYIAGATTVAAVQQFANILGVPPAKRPDVV